MMEPIFYPKDQIVPVELTHNDFFLRPLRATDVELDYEAVMESKEYLRHWGQSTWPTDDFSIADNLEDLKLHEREHEKRIAFTYTMMNRAETVCLGAIYIRPLRVPPPEWTLRTGDFPEPVEGEATVTFWIRTSEQAGDLDKRLIDSLLTWFDEEWSFPRISFRTTEALTRQMQLFTDAGLRERYVIKRPDNLPNRILYSH